MHDVFATRTALARRLAGADTEASTGTNQRQICLLGCFSQMCLNGSTARALATSPAFPPAHPVTDDIEPKWGSATKRSSLCVRFRPVSDLALCNDRETDDTSLKPPDSAGRHADHWRTHLRADTVAATLSAARGPRFLNHPGRV